jgi:hypothetical protein
VSCLQSYLIDAAKRSHCLAAFFLTSRSICVKD